MQFFSDLDSRDERALVADFLCKGDFCVAGFGKGARSAFEYALSSTQRVDILQLYAPVFFTNNWEKEKLQTIIAKGIKIEVYLFAKDITIDNASIKDFFQNYVTIYTIKNR